MLFIIKNKKMKKYFIIPVMLLFSGGLFSQGLYNNGAKMVIGAGASVYLDGTGGNYLNESNGTDGEIALDGTLILKGNYTNNVAGADIMNSVGANAQVEFVGSAIQTLGGTTTAGFLFNHLLFNNPAGFTIAKNVTVNGIATFDAGVADIGDNDFDFGLSASVAGTPSSSAMIVATGAGQVKKLFDVATSFTFPVGDNDLTTEYSPVTLDFTGGTFAPGAFAGISLANMAYPDPYITTSYLNRYWNVTQTGITGFTCNALFQYQAADVVGNESDIYCVRIDPKPVVPYDPANTTQHLLTASGLNSFGIFTGALGIKTLSLSLFLEGLYNGGGAMNQAQGATGNEFPGTTADQITVELHDATTYSTLVYSAGNVNLGTNGAASIEIPSNYPGSYYLTVKNRNHLTTVSALPVDLSIPLVSYDFTTSDSKAFGNNQKLLETGIYGFYTGDSNQDGVVDGLDMLSTQNDITNASTGYIPTDFNGDGVLNALDLALAQANALIFISTITP